MRGCHDSFLWFDYLLKWLTEFRETLSYVYQFIIKDIGEQLIEEVHRVRSGIVLSAANSVLVLLGYVPPSQHVYQPRSSSNLVPELL